MLKELFDGIYKPEFQYLIWDSIRYDHKKLTLSGKFKFQNSPYLISPDKIMNVEDGVFIMHQAAYALIANYFLKEKHIDFLEFRKNWLDNIVLTNINYYFNNTIEKEKDTNDFLISLESTKFDSKGRFWFHQQLSLSNDKFKSDFSGAVLHQNIHNNT